MERIAIIGSGIAGMGCLHYLRHHAELTLYEREDYLGGHTNTVEIDEDGRRIPVDTGFMVFNRVTYPNILRLFAELGVESVPADMSFGVNRPEDSFCWSSKAPLARPANLLAPRFWKMILDARRFNREARQLLHEGGCSPILTIGEWSHQQRYSRDFLDFYLLPMSGAIWSTPPAEMEKFPILSLLHFFNNHALLGFKGHHQWYTLRNGSRSYRDRLIAVSGAHYNLGSPVSQVERLPGKGVRVTTSDGSSAHYDKVILASHADEALNLLVDPDENEKRLLGAFAYSRNPVLLHTCEKVMPPIRKAWAAWNFRYDRDSSTGLMRGSTHYWMNTLQPLATYGARRNYFVSVNDPGIVPEEAILKRFSYTHPLFTAQAILAREQLPELNRTGPVYFCGSYFRHGFHEDGLLAALHVVQKISPEAPPILQNNDAPIV